MREFQFPRPKTDLFTDVTLDFTKSRSLTLPITPISLVKDLPPLLTTIHDYSFSIDPIQKGRLYANKSIPPAAAKGLVLLCHGATNTTPQDQLYLKTFDLLARSIAEVGFVVVSMRHSSLENGGIVGAQISFIKHTIFLMTDPGFTAKFKLQGKPLIFVGQSESGHGAALAARQIKNGLLPNLVSSVSALVGVAPSVGDNETIDGHADSLLIMQGTHDGDTTPKAESLRAYEMAAAVPFRSFIWLHGANHAAFLEATSGNDLQTFGEDALLRINGVTQRLIARNYITSFLQWRVLGDSSRSKPFLGDGTFDFKSNFDPLVQMDIKDFRLKVFPRYAAAPSSMCIPGALVFQDILQQDGKLISGNHPAEFLPLRFFEGSLDPQTTDGFRIQWKKPQFANPQVFVPFHGFSGSSKFVEFDATMVNFGIPIIVPSFLRLVKNGKVTFSKTVDLTMPAPLIMKTAGITRSLVSTIRIPISVYGTGSNVEKSTMLVLDFKSAGASSGDLAFSKFSVRSE